MSIEDYVSFYRVTHLNYYHEDYQYSFKKLDFSKGAQQTLDFDLMANTSGYITVT